MLQKFKIKFERKTVYMLGLKLESIIGAGLFRPLLPRSGAENTDKPSAKGVMPFIHKKNKGELFTILLYIIYVLVFVLSIISFIYLICICEQRFYAAMQNSKCPV